MSQSDSCSCNLYTNAQAVKWLILQEVAMDQGAGFVRLGDEMFENERRRRACRNNGLELGV
jgi:hypothetical protein